MLEYALQYAKLGWHIFPLKPGGKTPITQHGVKDATTEEAEIRDWWTRWPNANIGLALGKISGVCAIDIDLDKEKDINGYESLRELGELPATVCQHTPRGGSHFLFHAEISPPNKNGLRPGIDIRSDGYYVVLAPSVHPNGGVYQWQGGHSPWDLRPAAYPDFMRVEREREAVSAIQHDHMRNDFPAIGDTLLQARAYFERVEPAVQGQRGHDCLLWAAQCCVNGLKMSDSDAYAFLAAEYNPRCVPPWNLNDPKDEKDFRRKIREARKNPTSKYPIGWIIDDPGFSVDGPRIEIDSTALIASAKAADAPAIVTSKKSRDGATSSRIPDDLRMPAGWLGEYIGYGLRNAPHPNWPLLFAGGLALWSAVTGRKIVGPSGLPTNLYVIGLALPGSGKNFPRMLNARILEAAGYLDILVDKLASAEGLEDRVAESPHVLLCQPDEMDSMIHTMEQGRDGRGLALGSLLNQLYTTSCGVYVRRIRSSSGDSTRPEPIIRPHVSLFGTATPRLYYEACGRRLLEGGFAARLLVLEADPRSNGRRQIIADLPPGLVEGVIYWKNFVPPDAGDIAELNDKFSRAALIVPAKSCGERALRECQEAADERYRHAEATSDAGAAAVWSRVYEQTEKVATLHASGLNLSNPEITGDIVRWANRMVIISARRALELAAEYHADSPFASKCQEIAKFIQGRGEVSARDVYRKYKLARKDFETYARSLEDQGKVAWVKLVSIGGTRELLRWIDE
jgi:hypothetical protein